MLTHRLFRLFVAIVLLLLIVMTSSGCVALPHREASGSFITTSTTIHSVIEDKFNEVIDLSSTITYTGMLEGTSVVEGTFVVHGDGSADFKGVETFTGLVYGMPGTLTFELVGSNNLYQEIQFTHTITSGTDQLANLQGKLSMLGMIKDNGPVGTYTGQINLASNLEVEETNED